MFIFLGHIVELSRRQESGVADENGCEG